MPRLSSSAGALATPLVALLAGTSLGAGAAGAHRAATPPQKARVYADVRVRRSNAPRGCANANAAVVGSSAASMRAAVVCLIDRERTRRGLPALRTSRRLDHSAQSWTNAMVGAQNFDHGAGFAARITAAGFSWRAAGENIATGYPTPAQVLRGWMASTGHCENILNPQYTYVGTGVNRRPVRPYGTGPATWTQDFALPMSASAPSGNWGPARGCPYSS